MDISQMVSPRDTQCSVVISLVGREFDVSDNEIRSERRTRRLVIPRSIAIWLLKEHTEMSLPRIGKAFGGRDHTTVIAAIKKVEHLRETDPHLAIKIANLHEAARVALSTLQKNSQAEALLATAAPSVQLGLNNLMQTFAIRVHALARENPAALAQIIAETTVKLGDAL